MKTDKKTRNQRIFSKKLLNEWIASDRLTEREQEQIETIIKRLP